MSDELQIIDGKVVVHSHSEAPCSRCGAMDLHDLTVCAWDTRSRVLDAVGLTVQPTTGATP